MMETFLLKIFLYIWNFYLTRMPLKQGDTLDDFAKPLQLRIKEKPMMVLRIPVKDKRVSNLPSLP